MKFTIYTNRRRKLFTGTKPECREYVKRKRLHKNAYTFEYVEPEQIEGPKPNIFQRLFSK